MQEYQKYITRNPTMSPHEQIMAQMASAAYIHDDRTSRTEESAADGETKSPKLIKQSSQPLGEHAGGVGNVDLEQ